ncbi:hypothetical protein CDL15_Pgr016766 [Punica granatum]|uniref:Uncharacterized protein n=1 Tax=Punica granatum TaxID=22663 RepID=A0A218WXW8_PUNGR|nr:hypothetical protein CDL15_Pgr016766 [Punica granatum]
MKVEIEGTSLVLPTTPPFPHPHTLPLSHLDSDPNLRVTFRYVRAYLNCPESRLSTRCNDDPFTAISSGLSSALIHYYPFAATLRPCPDNPRRLELFCAPSQGVPLIHAKADCTLESVEYLDGAAMESVFIEQLAPDPSADEMMINPCILQVTVFKCGGFALGAAINHAMCDGVGATQFFGAVAELARGTGQISIEPIWDRPAHLGPRDPPRITAPIEEFRGRAMVNQEGVGTKVVVREWVHVRDELLERFKSWLVEKCGVSFTTFEALGAFIWRAKVKACGIPLQDNVAFSYSINISKIAKPPLPVGYWGNCCIPIYIYLAVSDLVNKPIWETAGQIRNSKIHATDEHLRSFIDFLELHGFRDRGGLPLGKSSHVSGFTDWRHLGHSKLDFGWGGPVTVVPLSQNILGSDEPCFFLPYSSAGKEKRNGFMVLVNLPESSVAGFREEMDKFIKQDYDF